MVDLIYKVSTENRACKQTPTLYALAICARSNDPTTKSAAYKILGSVCRIPTHLFEFVNYCEKESAGTGWGRAQRVAIGKWYNEKDPKKLAYLVTKYEKRHGWSHRDVVRLAHVKSKDKKIKMILKYVTNMESANLEYTFDKSEEDIKSFLEGVEAAKKCTREDIDKLCGLIVKHELVREHVPTELLASKEIWGQLFRKMPMMAMLRSLGKMSSLELLTSGSFEEELVVSKLNSKECLKSAHIHPFSLLVALKQYKTGHGNKGKLSWTVNTIVTTALEGAFYTAFQFLPPTRKRYLLAVDVSASMHRPVFGSSGIKAFEASLAMVLLTAKTEANFEVIPFSREYTKLDIKKDDTLDSVLKKCDGLQSSVTDCSMPMQYAMTNKKEFDVFIVYTDSEIGRSTMDPAEALRQYREYSKIKDARLIVVGMVSNGFTVADPNDTLMMDIVGFDTDAPKAMMNFVNGMF